MHVAWSIWILKQNCELFVADSDMNLHTVPDIDDDIQENFPVSVILQSKPASSRWVDVVWHAVGVVVGSRNDQAVDKPRLIHTEGEAKQYLCTGMDVALHIDECESYYHNLISATPRCYVVAHTENYDDMPEPFLVSMSFDEAHAYLEGEDQVYAVDVPAELYRWTEAFILAHYAPQQRKKRKRKDWRKQDSGSFPS
jgi:hypothetical protein